jgi:hypothetical protein
MTSKFTIKGVRKFNEEKVIDNALELLESVADDKDVMRRSNDTVCGETASYMLMTEGFSTQGITIKQMVGGTVAVELPWLASEMDVRLCYAFLNAVKKVHRAARIMEENERDAKLADCDAQEQWGQRCNNMKSILDKGEAVVVTGVTRDFHLNPQRYVEKDGQSIVDDVFNDFIALQWIGVDAVNVREEKRHISEDEELSTLRVVDNTHDVFIGACRYVGMVKGNTCKMVLFSEFCKLMDGHGGFKQLDEAQVLLDKMEDEDWNKFFDAANGFVREHFRKTFIMRWNTDISNYKLTEFDEAMNDFHEDGFYYDWSIWDYQKAHIGDRFYMIRTGKGRNGVVMRGTIIGSPYPDEDWSGKGRKVYYIRMSLSHMIHPEDAPFLLSTDELNKGVPGFCWDNGHSGEMLNDEQAEQLEEVWKNYVEQMHGIASEYLVGDDFNKVYKERGWEEPEIYQSQGSHFETLMDLDHFPDVVTQIGQWPLYGSSCTNVTSDDYDDEEANILAVRTGEDMGLMALLLNNIKSQRLDFLTLYPCHHGTKHMMTIRKVFEWENHVEAIVWAEMEELSLAFFATDYYENKQRYIPGNKMEIELAASAYSIEEGKKELTLSELGAEIFRRDMGLEKEYDENGNLIPITLNCENLVSYFDSDKSCPDDADFISPVSEVEEVSLLGNDYIKVVISICHEPEDTFIPVYYKKEMFPNVEKGMPVQGRLWMQGKISE